MEITLEILEIALITEALKKYNNIIIVSFDGHKLLTAYTSDNKILHFKYTGSDNMGNIRIVEI
jgi:hypothetical protein